MRKIFYCLTAALAMAFASCSDWTEPEAKQMTRYNNTEIAKTETYYKALRDWKKTKHSITFGWYGGWSDPAASTANMLSGIPDSMDVVSLWDGATNLSEGKRKDLEFVQKVKGTKIVMCSFTKWVGDGVTPAEYNESTEKRHEFWGWKDGDQESKEAAVRKYAQAFLDTIAKYNYDGFDIDYEPQYGYGGELASSQDLMKVFILELAKELGPMSPNPEKLLIVDGEPEFLHTELGPYLSYFVIQAYHESESGLDGRLNKGINKFKSVLDEETITNRYVMTENLESAMDCLAGGYTFRKRDGRAASYKSLEGFARWQPLNGYLKGGCGGYHFDGEAANTPAYKWMRNAIQVMNPAVIK